MRKFCSLAWKLKLCFFGVRVRGVEGSHRLPTVIIPC
jgi:hypothetical protein